MLEINGALLPGDANGEDASLGEVKVFAVDW